MGVRTNAATTDFSDILPEDVETSVKEAAGQFYIDIDILLIIYLFTYWPTSLLTIYLFTYLFIYLFIVLITRYFFEEVSMGTEIAEEDIDNIRQLCTQVIEISTYRASLYEYLHNRYIQFFFFVLIASLPEWTPSHQI